MKILKNIAVSGITNEKEYISVFNTIFNNTEKPYPDVKYFGEYKVFYTHGKSNFLNYPSQEFETHTLYTLEEFIKKFQKRHLNFSTLEY